MLKQKKFEETKQTKNQFENQSRLNKLKRIKNGMKKKENKFLFLFLSYFSI